MTTRASLPATGGRRRRDAAERPPVAGSAACGRARHWILAAATWAWLLGMPVPGRCQVPAASTPPSDADGSRGTNAAKTPVPSDQAVWDARQIISQAYGGEVTASGRSPAEVRATIRKLLNVANETQDAARRYALLLVSQEMAVRNGFVDTATELLERRHAAFEFDPHEARNALIESFLAGNNVPPDRLFRYAIETCEAAIWTDTFSAADTSAGLAERIAKNVERHERAMAAQARQGKRPPPPRPVASKLLAEAAELSPKIERRRRAFEHYEAARKALAANPTDEAAAEVVGAYLCFVKDDWQQGIPILAICAAPALRDVARRELAGAERRHDDVREALGLADSWWRLAQTDGGEKGAARRTSDVVPREPEIIRSHAAGIYTGVLPRIQDPIDRDLAQKRIAAAESERASLPRRTAPRVQPPTFLADLPAIDKKLQNNWFEIGKVWGVPIVHQGEPGPHGIFLHARPDGVSSVKYRIDPAFRLFESGVFVPKVKPNQGNPATPLKFEVWGNGKSLWSSRPIGTMDVMQDCAVPLDGVTELQLRVVCPGRDNWGVAVWFEPRLVK